MEAIIFCGIQATGKSTFYRQHFFNSHVRISMDLLRTRHREDLFLDACLKSYMPFVVDNTNPTLAERAKYIALAKASRYRVKCYYFSSSLEAALERNSGRVGRELVPEKGVRSAYHRLAVPVRAEGYDEMYYITQENNQFIIKPWMDEV
ncbi:ATP-binding protein [Chitinophaga sp. CB10]|uniref:ATP-binding protein n=1 Tax=Chitinophaga sp. CB10 TaxID=1891659 RepID=UPI000A59A4C7|nr:ATP-binding protein [Chitinophaga sp. CB10]